MPTAVHVEPIENWQTVSVRISTYWPALGGVNCFSFVNGECISRMSSGERWQDWVFRAAACVPEWPFWTQIRLPGGEELICLDRGSKIIIVGEVPWIDILTNVAPVPYGTIIEIGVLFP